MTAAQNSKKANEEDACFDRERYQSAVGSLLYLSTKTRPDISYAVGVVARFSAKPTNIHWSAVKRIFRYLNGTTNLGLLYKHQTDVGLYGYSDADYAGDRNDRKSTSGYVFLISGGAISWKSKKQSCVALSTAEAEYMALASTIQEAIWLRQLLSNLHQNKPNTSEATTIFEDNQSAIWMARNQQCHGQSKHIDVKYHFVREKVSEGVIELRYCDTTNMLADMFTKGLNGPQFKKLKKGIGMINSI